MSERRRGDAQALALTEQLGAQLRRMKGGGAKIAQFLSMLTPDRDRSQGALGTLGENVQAVPFGRARKVLEGELDAPLRKLFAEFDEDPFAMASVGQVHRARTQDGADVAVKVQHPDAADAIEADLRNLGLVGAIVKRLAPGVDAGALLAEVRERISDELDYELEAQHQRRLERRFRGHPHIRVARVHTDLCTRRVLVTEYVEGLGPRRSTACRGRTRPRGGAGLPLLLRPRLARRCGRRGPAPRQLPAVRRRPLMHRGLRPAARPRGGRTSTASGRSCARSPKATLRASTTGSPPSATCPSRQRSIPRPCSSISRPPASGCSRRDSAGSTTITSSASSSSAIRRAHRGSGRCAACGSRRRRS